MWPKCDVQALPNLSVQELITGGNTRIGSSAHPELNFNAMWFK